MTTERQAVSDVYMPRFAWDYERCTEAEHWFLTARAFRECSCHLFTEMVERRLSGSFHHAKAAASVFEHAVELFLKGGIAQAGKPVPTHHLLHELYGQFKNLYPGKKFQFTGAIAEMVQPSSQTPHNEFARYPTDQSGKLWSGSPHIDLVTWREQATRFLADFKRLEPLLKDRYPKS